MTDIYGNELKVGDKICWAPYRAYVAFGTITGFTRQCIRATLHWRGTNFPTVVKTRVVYKIKELPKYDI